MNRAFSLYLDGLRLIAAVMVLCAHWAFPRFTGQDHIWMRYHDLGGDGVVIFFVLSGMLITYAAERRRQEGAALFAADRLSRLWSVAIPALLFCYILDLIGQAAAPDIYGAVGYSGGVSATALLSGATFTNQVWFLGLQPGSNGPYWSLGYEAWYYLIFAAFFFAPSRWRWWLAGAAALVAGPKILLLAPSWIMGVWVWRAIASGQTAKLSRATGLVLTVLPLMLYLFGHASFLHLHLGAWTETIMGEAAIAMIGPSDTFIWSTLLGVLTSLHILGVATLFAKAPEATSVRPLTERVIRWLAGGSFALYLVHFPVMHLFGAILPGSVEAPWRQAALIILPCIIAYMFAEVTERRRPALRGLLRKIAMQKPDRRSEKQNRHPA